MVRFDAALLLGRMLPRRSRHRVFEAAYQELLAEYLAADAVASGFDRLWRRLGFELRAVAIALECWRLLLAGRLGRDRIVAGNAPPHRPARRGNRMESFVRDVRYSARQLLKAPVFSATAVLIIAIGIGANTAAFSVVNAMLLRPVPFDRPEELVDIYQDSDDGQPNSSSYPAYRDIASYEDLFAGVTATFERSVSLQQEGNLVPLSAEFSPSNYMEVLGLRVAIGRWFDAAEDVAGGEAVAVLSHRAWRERFGGDAGILGAVLRVNGAPVTVVGVGPKGYDGLTPLDAVDGWLSLSSLGPLYGSYAMATLQQRGDHWFVVKARLRDNVTSEQAQEAMNGLAARLAAEFPEHNDGRRITVFGSGRVRIHPSVDGMLAPSAALLMTIVGLVLLIACSNLANLLLARAAARDREMSIRLALGANRGRLSRQLLTESLLLSVVGGVLGFLIAYWSLRVLVAIQLPLPVSITADLSLDVRVLFFALGLSVFTGIAFGAAPAIRASRPDLTATMREKSSLPVLRGRRFGLRNGLVVIQVAMSFVLLVVAGLFIRSLGNAGDIEPGFSIDDVAYMEISPTFAAYSTGEARNIMQEFVERARALPGIEAASLGSTLPVVSRRGTTTLVIDGYQPPSDIGTVEVPFNIVDEGYFETLRIPLLRGRPFTNVDRADTEPVAVVSEAMAKYYWGGQDAVGRRFRSQGGETWVRVVGVVGDTTIRDLTEDAGPQMYRPWTQSASSVGVVFARTSGDPAAAIGMLRGELRAIDAEIPVRRAGTMAGHLSDSLSLWRTAVRLLGGFGIVALVLASLGLYGVVSAAASRRLVEVGVRMALGAESGQIIWLVLKEVAVLVGVGVVFGLGLSSVATAGLAGLLFGVSTTDPITFAAVSAAMLAVAIGAAIVPALRATKADPVAALRAS